MAILQRKKQRNITVYMKDNKKRIDTYTNLYGVDLVVVNEYVSLEDLVELYEYSDKVELDNDIMNACASASKCYRKSDNKPIVLVKYNHPTYVKGINKQLDLINTISHEACHVALYIYEFIEQTPCFCSPEPFCYLLGWATECIYKTLKRQ